MSDSEQKNEMELLKFELGRRWRKARLLKNIVTPVVYGE